MHDELLESADAGRVLGLTPAAVRQLARRGTLPVARVLPRGVRLFTREAIEELARERDGRAADALGSRTSEPREVGGGEQVGSARPETAHGRGPRWQRWRPRWAPPAGLGHRA